MAFRPLHDRGLVRRIAAAERMRGGITGGSVVSTPGRANPYKVVLEHRHTNDSEHEVASVSEGEAYIRLRRNPAGGGGFVARPAIGRRPGLCPTPINPGE